jgi:protease-4
MKINGKLFFFGVCFLMAVPLFSQNVYLELNLNSPPVQNMLRTARSGSELEILRVIERASKDDRIGGIILNISSYSAGQHTLWELRNALEKFKSTGKKVCAFISAADLDLYCLATTADKIVMDELGTLMLPGYAWGRGYVQHSLEKLGIGVRELRYLEYKSASETYTRDSLSDADRRQYGEILDDIMNITRDTITKARSLTAQQFDSVLNEFLFSSKSAIDRGLVDRAGRKEAVLEAVKEISGNEKAQTFVVWGDQDTSVTESKNSYGPGKAGGLFSKPPIIAVVYANGVTDMEQGIAARNLASTIKETSEQRRVKAMVIRINSPGGSAEAADYIAEAIKNARERIPVVVSMGAVAASGGYWASMSANHIIASPVTLTGSIGVIGSWFYDKGLNKKLGLTVDTMQRGNHADLMTGIILPHRDLNQGEEARYRKYILDLYGSFTAKVAAYRNMEIDRVESLAQGRVYSGLGAFNSGLIDGIGGLDDALRIARELAEIPEGSKVAYSEFPKPKFIDKLLDRILSMQVAANAGSRAASYAGVYSETVTAARTASAFAVAAFAADLFLPAPLLEDLRFRITHNGQVMPLLPLNSPR